MRANKYTLRISDNDLEVPFTIEMNWDFLDRENDLQRYQQEVIEEVINQDKDFETARFAHKSYPIQLNIPKTEINYQFYFAPTGATSANTIWVDSYLTEGFTPPEVYYLVNSFKKSFFKLDLYNTTGLTDQKAYLTIIIPTTQGLTENVPVGLVNQDIKKPVFKLDYIGDKEGFFIYWLKKRDFINLDTFYMTAKFFDGKIGTFVKMMTVPQSTLIGQAKFNFPQELYFYYKVELDYNDFTYVVRDVNTNNRVGTIANPIKWYEYINP